MVKTFRVATQVILYKYLSCDRIDVLAYTRIRFSQPGALNDLFEGFPSLEKLRQTIVVKNFEQLGISFDKYNEEHVEFAIKIIHLFKMRMFNLFNKNVLILSLSKKRNNSLMWSHYANSHNGFVIGFDSNVSAFNLTGKKTETTRKISREVTYSKRRYILPMDVLNGITPKLEQEMTSEILFTKDTDWSYEQEYRVVASTESADLVLNPESNLPVYLFDFRPESIKEIILGHRLSEDKRDILKVLAKNHYKEAKILYAFPSDRSFDMDIDARDNAPLY